MSSDAEILLACIAALAAIIFFVASVKLPLWAAMLGCVITKQARPIGLLNNFCLSHSSASSF